MAFGYHVAPMSTKKHFVLVTGSSGAVGRTVVEGLLEAGHRVRGFDRQEHPSLEDQVVAELTDADAVRRAVEGVDRVIHLAAYPNPAPFVQVLVPSNVIGLYHVVMSAVGAGVKRIALASTMQVVGRNFRDNPPVGVDVEAPFNDYALTKIWAEHLGRMVARQHKVEVIAARIGWFVRNARQGRHMLTEAEGQAVYTPRSDTKRFFNAVVEVDKIDTPDGFAVLYCCGPGTKENPCPFDLEPGRRILGYDPQVSYPDEMPTE